MAALVAAIAELKAQIAGLEPSSQDRFEMHPDAKVIRSLPGLGMILGVRALGEFRNVPNRYADTKSRQNYAAHPSPKPPARDGSSSPATPVTAAWPTPVSGGPSPPSPPAPAPGRSTTNDGRPATLTKSPTSTGQSLVGTSTLPPLRRHLRRTTLLVRGPALQEREASLGSDLHSASKARRLLRQFLVDIGRHAWLDAAELAISEVVTNASLHAHTPIEIRLSGYVDQVCVEVRDFNSTLPVQRNYDVEATTGRGMSLVAAITLECGVHPLGEGGKVVWFCVGDPPPASAEDILGEWDVDAWPEPPSQPAGTRRVVLASMPATLWLSARQHHDAILREFVLYCAEHGAPKIDLAAADKARSTISNALTDALGEAHGSGMSRPVLPQGHPSPLPWVPDQLDLGIDVTADTGWQFAALQDALDVAETLALEGNLLLRPGLPEIIAVRDWACEQVIAQLSGSPPAPWPGTAQMRFETEVRSPGVVEWDSSSVADSDRGVIAADDANRIVAVSRPLARLLGWRPQDLVGRRVVTVVPPALREAHVAGFSRHLTTGEAHVLSVPLDLPVLRKDGSEVQCRFMIERAPANSGRSVYMAWIEPLEPPEEE